MNSDNSALCGVTLDYGPFAFMERFNPIFCPWVGGGMEYSFGRQPQAIAINLTILAEAFAAVLQVRDSAFRASERRALASGSLQRALPPGPTVMLIGRGDPGETSEGRARR